MGSITTLKTLQYHPSITKINLLSYIVYAIVPIVLLTFYFYPSYTPTFSSFTPISFQPKEKEVNENIEILPSLTTENTTKNIAEIPALEPCNYSDGDWVQDDNTAPLYNDSTCETISYGQHCIGHGRPDKGYLYYKWKPRQCNLPNFNPKSFMQIIEGKHLAFVGDSLARNQVESLICMLNSAYASRLVYSSGEDGKFRKWQFPGHNASVSIYWSAFLVKADMKEKNGTRNHHRLYFDSADARWASDLVSIDIVVLSMGHWFMHPAVYLDGDAVIGCYNVHDLNCTEIEYFHMFGKAFNTSLKAILDHNVQNGLKTDVIVTTVSPHHFEGDWDKFGACPKTEPFREGEKVLEGVDANMRKVQVEEVQKARGSLGKNNVRIEVVDVTKLSMLRPDGHPGAYLYPNPLGDGLKKVQNDCVHWCLPGPIDTWNEIMFDIMTRWRSLPNR